MGFYEKYDAVIIGGGMAGLTAAAYLSREGKKVLVCEKEAKPGGLVGSFYRNGFLFDSGIRAFENSGIILPMLRDLGISVDLVKSPVAIGIENALIRYNKKESLDQYKLLLMRQFPENKKDIQKIIAEIRKVIKYMDVLYGIDNPLFMDYKEDKKYLFNTLLPWLIKYQINIRKALKLNQPVNDYLSKFTDNSELIDIITQHFFKETPAFFALSYFGLYLDYSYPKGGTFVLVDKMIKFIEKNGGKIKTDTKITRIDPVKREVLSIDRNYQYQALIWAADMKAFYQSLIEDEKIKDQKELVLKAQAGESIFTLYLEIDQAPDYFKKKMGPHLFYTPEKKGLSSLDPLNFWEIGDKELLIRWLRSYLKLTTYEISTPVLRDPSLAPAGKTGLIISTLMDYQLVKQIDKDGWYQEFKHICEEEIIEILNHSIFSDLKIENAFSSTPLSIERITGNSEGGITGWAFTNEKIPAINEFTKIKNSVKTDLPNIYQAGQWTFSPSGLPISILTGKLAADEVSQDLKKKR